MRPCNSMISVSHGVSMTRSLAAVLRDRDVAAIAALGDLAPDPLGVARAAGLHGVDGDAAVDRHADHLRVFGVLGVVHVRRRIADQEQDAADVARLASTTAW